MRASGSLGGHETSPSVSLTTGFKISLSISVADSIFSYIKEHITWTTSSMHEKKSKSKN